MIILVWNVALSAEWVVAPRSSREAGMRLGVATWGSTSETEAAEKGPAGSREPLTVRQRFLLGHRVDINRADAREISGLPGISDAVAEAVVSQRKRVGRFRRAEDLLAVRGIKRKRLKKILPFISVFPNN